MFQPKSELPKPFLIFRIEMMWPDPSWNYTELSNVYFDGNNTAEPPAAQPTTQATPAPAAQPPAGSTTPAGVNMRDLTTPAAEHTNIEHWPPNAVYNTYQRLNSLRTLLFADVINPILTPFCCNSW